MSTEIEAQIDALQAVLAAQKQRYRRQGPWLIAIGVLWVSAFVADVLLALAGAPSWYQFVPWLVLTVVAFGLTRWRRDPTDQGVAVRWHDRVVGGLWLALVIGMWVTATVGASGRIPNGILLPLLEWWTAIGMIVTGLLFGAPWFWRAGILWFVGGVVSFYLPQTGDIIVYPTLIVVAFIGPAIWLSFTEHRVYA